MKFKLIKEYPKYYLCECKYYRRCFDKFFYTIENGYAVLKYRFRKKEGDK